MPRRPSKLPSMQERSYAQGRQGIPMEEWPEDLIGYWKERENIERQWWRQLKLLSKIELRGLALAGALCVRRLEAELTALQSEIANRDSVRTMRGRAAQLPEIAEFKAWVQKEWELARDAAKPSATIAFASRMISRKDAPIADTKTIQRWCRKWEEQRRLAVLRSTYRKFPTKAIVRPDKNIYFQLGVVPPEFRTSHEPEEL